MILQLRIVKIELQFLFKLNIMFREIIEERGKY